MRLYCPRSSVDRALVSEAMCAGSIPAEGTVYALIPAIHSFANFQLHARDYMTAKSWSLCFNRTTVEIEQPTRFRISGTVQLSNRKFGMLFVTFGASQYRRAFSIGFRELFIVETGHDGFFKSFKRPNFSRAAVNSFSQSSA